MSLSRKHKTIVASMLAIAILLLVGLWAAIDWLDPFNDQAFAPTVWSKRGTGLTSTRAPMARDLVRSHLPLGLSRARVESLLGPPDDVRTREDAGGNRLPGTETYAYHIGSWSGSPTGFDDTFVYVHFDANGKVIGAEINGY